MGRKGRVKPVDARNETGSFIIASAACLIHSLRRQLEREFQDSQEMALLHDIPRSGAPSFTPNGEVDGASPDHGMRQRNSANGHGGFASGSVGRVGGAAVAPTLCSIVVHFRPFRCSVSESV